MYSPLSMVGLLPRGGIPEGNSSSIPHGDLSSFGPASATGFDFTPLFENTILSVIPSGLLLLALPYRISTLQGRRPKVAHGGVLHDSKQLFLVVFAAMNLALLTLHVLTPSQRTGIRWQPGSLCALASRAHPVIAPIADY
jgi:ATP-binding cassette, subfamily C (CFTR/MRP), member 1